MVSKSESTLISLLRYISKWRGVCYICNEKDMKISTKTLLCDLDDMSKMVESLFTEDRK